MVCVGATWLQAAKGGCPSGLGWSWISTFVASLRVRGMSMRLHRSQGFIGLAIALALVLAGGLLGTVVAGAAAPQQPPATGGGPVAERVGTIDVRALAGKGPRVAGAARTPHEFSAEAKEKGEGSGSTSSLPRPSPANRSLVSRENHRGWEGLDHADQRLAAGGNQFSLEPPDQGLCVGGQSPNGAEFGPEVVESVNDALTFYD